MISMASVLNGTFRYLGDNVAALAVWAGLGVLLSIGSRIAMRPMIEAQIAAMTAGGAPSPPPLGGLAILVVAVFAVCVILYAAIFRGVIAPADRRAAYLRVGMDELRLFALLLVLGLGGYIAFVILAALLVAAAVAIALAAGWGELGAIGLALLAMLPLFALALFFVVRLSPAGALTILRRKLIIGEAWRVTRGHFWVLLGSYAIVALLLMAGYAAIMLITVGPLFSMMAQAGGNPALLQPQVAAWQLQQMSLDPTPHTVLVILAGAVISTLMLALQGGAVAVATMQLVDDRRQVFA